MFFSKRNSIYYLLYVDAQGRRQKISTRSTTKSGALAFLQTFKPKELVTTVTTPIELRKKISDPFANIRNMLQQFILNTRRDVTKIV